MGIFDRLTERVGGIFGEFIEEVMIPDAVHQDLQRAARLYDRGDWQGALEIIERIEQAQPELARIHHLKGLIHLNRGAPQEAARALRRALELKETAMSHFYAGLAMEQVQEWRGAQDHLRRALALDPSASFEQELCFAMGRIYLAQGRAAKAIRELRKAQRIGEAPAEVSITLAEAALERGQLEQAQAALEHAGAHTLEGAHPHLVRARVAAAHEDLDGALGPMSARPPSRARRASGSWRGWARPSAPWSWGGSRPPPGTSRRPSRPGARSPAPSSKSCGGGSMRRAGSCNRRRAPSSWRCSATPSMGRRCAAPGAWPFEPGRPRPRWICSAARSTPARTATCAPRCWGRGAPGWRWGTSPGRARSWRRRRARRWARPTPRC